METSLFIELTNKTLFTVGILAIPILIPGLIAGILISLFQAVTQISEQTLSFVPKLFILILSYVITGPWLIRFLVNFSIEIINRVPELARDSSMTS